MRNNTAFLDLMLNLCLGIFTLFAIAFFSIQVEQSKADVKLKAEFVIVATWPKELTSDVDLWVADPAGNTMYYGNKESGMMHLDRDDLGNVNDVITLPSGQKIECSTNQEVATIRGIIPGEWIVNVHLFRWDGRDPIPVTVRIDDLNPKVTRVAEKTVNLLNYGHEITITRMLVSASGDVLSLDPTPKELCRMQWLNRNTSSTGDHGI